MVNMSIQERDPIVDISTRIEQEQAFLRRLARVDLGDFALPIEVRREIQLLRKLKENGGYSFACENCGREPSRVMLVQLPNGQGKVLKIGHREVRGIKIRLCDSC